MRILIGATLLFVLTLALTACDDTERLPSQEQVEEAGQEQPAVAEADVTRAGQAESQPSQGEAEVVTRAEPQEEQDTDEQTSSDTAERLFDPDAEDLSQLIYWGPDDGFFGVLLPIPSTVQYLLDLLLASGSPAADKYIVDLAAFPGPLRDQVMLHLADRFGVTYRTIYEYEDIWDFNREDSSTPGYLRFKQALFAGSLEEIADFLDPEAARTIDAREVMWGGVIVDGIPPLEHPNQIWPDRASEWINDSDVIVGVELNGDARAYPIRIIAWHEMVNDTIGGIPVSLAYCTLCGSPILFDGRVGSEVYRFGTSGLLYRSNKLMYDRNTRTLWNQFSGKPAWGPLVGEDIRLQVLPVVVTTWSDWFSRHPDTTVLSIETGFARDYGPGVAYNDYFNSPLTWFNVPIQDDRLAAKDNVYAVRVGETLTAYPVALLAERVLVHDEVGGASIVVIATGDGEGGRAYESGEIVFASADPAAGTLIDADGVVWTISEGALLGPEGMTLPRIAGHNAYWFAVTNHSTDAILWEG